MSTYSKAPVAGRYRCATVGCDIVVPWPGQLCLACRLDRKEPECTCACTPGEKHWCLTCPAHGVRQRSWIGGLK